MDNQQAAAGGEPRGRGNDNDVALIEMAEASAGDEHDTMHHIMRLNSSGITQLRRLSFADSIQIFSTLARQIRRLLTLHRQEQEPDADVQFEEMLPVVITTESIFPPAWGNVDTDMILEECSFRIFDKAFRISSPASRNRPLVTANHDDQVQEPAHPPALSHQHQSFPFLARVSAISLFNVALAHHLRAIKTQGNQETDFRKSLALYELSLPMVASLFRVVAAGNDTDEEQRRQREEQERRNCRLLLLAIHNNMAHIHAHFFENAAFVACIQAIRGLLAAGGEPDASSHNELFWLNLLVGEALQDVAPSA